MINKSRILMFVIVWNDKHYPSSIYNVYHLIQIHRFQQVIQLVDQKDLTKVRVRSQLDLTRSKKWMRATNLSGKETEIPTAAPSYESNNQLKRASLSSSLVISSTRLVRPVFDHIWGFYLNEDTHFWGFVFNAFQFWAFLREGFKNPSNGNFPLTFSPAVVR